MATKKNSKKNSKKDSKRDRAKQKRRTEAQDARTHSSTTKAAKLTSEDLGADGTSPSNGGTTGWREDPKPLLRVGAGFRLADTDPDATPGFEGKKVDGERELVSRASDLDTLQEKLFANSLFDREGDQHRSLLLVLQGMDSSGKGGIVRHVVGSVDPQGVTHASFKKPTEEELSHDFLWRIRKRLPAMGQIGVFDRSHYEDVLAGRVLNLASPDEIDARYGLINDFEHELVEQGTSVIKVFLNIGPDEQKARLGARLERPDKHWKYNPNDIDSRLLWNQYQDAYQTVFDRTSTEAAPWHVIPANHKWYARLAVQHLVQDALQRLDLCWPPADYDVDAEKARLAAT